MDHDLYLCGWRVRSALPLPELTAWDSDLASHPPDIEIVPGPIAAPPESALVVTPKLCVAGDTAWLVVDDIGSLSIERGCRITFELHPGVDERRVRPFLLGSGIGLLCHQRAVLPLHASSVAIDGVAVAFAGPGGAGKSTLAAALVHRGHVALADDITVIDAGPTVLPAFPRFKLHSDSLRAAGFDAAAADDVVAGGKLALRLEGTDTFARRSVSLGAVWVFSPTASSTEPLVGVEAVAALHRHVYRRKAGEALRRDAALFQDVGRVAATVPVRRLFRSDALADLGALVRCIESVAA